MIKPEQNHWILASRQHLGETQTQIVGLSAQNGLLYIWLPTISKAVHPHEFSLEKTVSASSINVSPANGHQPRQLTLPDQTTLLVSQTPALNQLLAALGKHETVAKKHWSRRGSSWLAITLICLFTLFAGYRWGLPKAADAIAQSLPESVGKELGDLSWKQMQAEGKFKPSQIPKERIESIKQRFAGFNPPPDYKRVKYDLYFFDVAYMGANAFAMPNGVVVVTDDLAKILTDDEILAVLSHEIGHIHHRHSLRQVVQASALGVVALAVFGDLSSVAGVLSLNMLTMQYSREAEFEADAYGGKILRHNQKNPMLLADALLKLEQSHKALKNPDGKTSKKSDSKEDEEGSVFDYLASHPATKERVEEIKKM